MRWKTSLFMALLTAACIFLLDHRWGDLPAFGRLFSPAEGYWRNAEPVDKDFSDEVHIDGLEQPVKIWLDERLVPHIFAASEHDLYFAQGYITARFRLWQMETQTRAAAGRLSEVMGSRTFAFDRLQRRKGMVYAAEQSLKKMEAQSETRNMIEAYTAGINAYIASLGERSLPIEYKLLGYHPEPWTPLKCALLLKYMSDDLTGYTDDLDYTNARRTFSQADFDLMFPEWPDTLDPIVPAGTVFPAAGVPAPQPPADSLWLSAANGFAATPSQPDADNGSNNWAVSGMKTKSGAPILCNDPHLGLNLPSLWFEVQLQAPGINVYGASLPGSPGVIIGFTDQVAWGVTNAERDVKDFYEIRFRDSSEQQYWYDGQWQATEKRIEAIRIKGKKTFYDTIAYTTFGPVMYDRHYPDTAGRYAALAMHWKAADPSNDLMTFYLLNHARNYDDYVNALQYYECPAQNFVFASQSGDIAIWEQGKFPVKWKEQGRFVMPGDDSAFQWRDYIPFSENPHVRNPERGFVSSANQHPTDASYPYYYNGSFNPFRGHRINDVLRSENNITVQDMMKLQNDTYNNLAAKALPLLFRFMDSSDLRGGEKRYWDLLKKWDLHNDPQELGPAIFRAWWDSLYANIWTDDLASGASAVLQMPSPSDNTTIEALLRDSSFRFVDDRRTDELETLRMQVSNAFHKAMQSVRDTDAAGKLPWGRYRGTDIMHLARLPAFSRMHLNTGGTTEAVNATKLDHGPSWRMVVQLSNPVEAYGVYPGGQSGNPGSRYYDNFVDSWVMGKYYPLHLFEKKDSVSRYVHYRMTLLK